MYETAKPDDVTAGAARHAPVIRRPADHPGEASRFDGADAAGGVEPDLQR